MLLASKGVGTSLSAVSHTGRQAQSHFASSTRAIHIPPYAASFGASLGSGVSAAARPTSGTASRVLHEARTALTRFFGHLRTPGLTHSVAEGGRYASTASEARVYGLATRQPTIHAQLSPHVRHALTGTRASFVPRARPPVRSTMDVGIGVVRNFSSSRPLFQIVVENVPIAGRTMCEADLDLKKRNKIAGRKVARTKQGENGNTKTKEMLKENKQAKDAAFDYYFPQADGESLLQNTTTLLLIPLAPTPSSRFPLSQHSASPKFLPLSSLGELHATHSLHSLRVSSLFSRLDSARVWDRGAACAAYGESSGLCTVLRVEFRGWTEGMVNAVIGDGGKGWCRVVQMSEDDTDGSDILDSSSNLSFTDFDTSSGGTDPPNPPAPFDPSTSFILPTLDFSSAFLEREREGSTCFTRASSVAATSFPPSPALTCSDIASPRLSHLSDIDIDSDEFNFSSTGSDSGSDRFSDYSVPNTISDVSWEEVRHGPLSLGSAEARSTRTGSSASRLGAMSFSSDFISRTSEPMETVFY